MTLLKQLVLPSRFTPPEDRRSVLRSAETRLGQSLSSLLESSNSASSRARKKRTTPNNSATRPPVSNDNFRTPPYRIRRPASFAASSPSPRLPHSTVPSTLRTNASSSCTPRRGEKIKKQRLGHVHHDVINRATLPDAIDD